MILVTGGTGFVGRNIVRLLAEKGQKVRCLVRDSSPRDVLDGLDVEFYTGDILVPDTLKEVFEGIDTVIHLVGIIKEIKGATFEKIHSGNRVPLRIAFHRPRSLRILARLPLRVAALRARAHRTAAGQRLVLPSDVHSSTRVGAAPAPDQPGVPGVACLATSPRRSRLAHGSDGIFRRRWWRRESVRALRDAAGASAVRRCGRRAGARSRSTDGDRHSGLSDRRGALGHGRHRSRSPAGA